MSLPKTFNAYRRSAGAAPYSVVLSTETLPTDLAPKDVLIKIHAVALNYRDILGLRGLDHFGLMDEGVPSSDAAAEVVAIGSDVKDFKIGDHVSPSFFNNRFTEEDRNVPQGLGGNVPGVLRQYAVFEERTLVHLPRHLSWEEVCAVLQENVSHIELDARMRRIK